nr:unnamed protein product [Callosobruchus chinensis]
MLATRAGERLGRRPKNLRRSLDFLKLSSLQPLIRKLETIWHFCLPPTIPPFRAVVEVLSGLNDQARKYFSPSKLLTLHKAKVRPSLEYWSHVWGAAAPTTLSILDAVQRRAIRLIGDPALTCHLQPLSRQRAVGDLSLFYWY